MKEGADQVRVIGPPRGWEPRPPGRGMAFTLIAVLIAGLTALFVGSGTEGDPTGVTLPLEAISTLPETTTTMLDRTPIVTATTWAPIQLQPGLGEVVPGWEGTLHLTVALLDGRLERWDWDDVTPGPHRRTLTAPMVDIGLDPSGVWLAAVDQIDDSLRVGMPPAPTKVFHGVLAYSWHQTDPGRIAWLSRGSDGSTRLHEGQTIEEGIYFRPVGNLPWLPAEDGTLRLRAFGDWGYLVERWSFEGQTRTVDVFTLDTAGVLLTSQSGRLLGVSPTGSSLVEDLSGGLSGTAAAKVEPSPGFYLGEARWSPDGTRVAIGRVGEVGTVVEISEGGATTQVKVDVLQPNVVGWSPDGRFIVVAGERGSAVGLAFVDTIDGTVTIIPVGAWPLGVVTTA